MIAERNPWKRIEVRYRELTFLMFLVVSACAWLFTHSLAITLPLVASTVIYGFGIAKTKYLEVFYPIFLGISVLIEFHNHISLLLIGEALLMVYFLLLKRIPEMTKYREELSHGNA
ncbi:MAG: hypothetical protein GXO14_01995 [Thermococci archaeon]|nr:hypothetical protein [Thermococci archaeon]